MDVAGGFFDEEIMPLEVAQGRKQPPLSVDADEHPRPTSTVDKLAKLPPIVADGKTALAQGVPRREVAAAFGVSRRTVDRWAAELAAVAGGGR